MVGRRHDTSVICIEHHAVMPPAKQALRHRAAHSSESYDPQLHVILFLWLPTSPAGGNGAMCWPGRMVWALGNLPIRWTVVMIVQCFFPLPIELRL